MKLKNMLIGFLFFLCLYWCSVGSCYEITEGELTTLETNLTKLAQINTTSQRNLTSLAKQLENSEKKSAQLEIKLRTLTETSRQQESLLQNANKSLKALEQEEKRKARTIKAQRIFIYALCVGLVYSLAK